MQELTETYIGRIAAKLANHGQAKSNYNREKSMLILGKTVAPVFCRKILLEHEEEVKKQLPDLPKED